MDKYHHTSAAYKYFNKIKSNKNNKISQKKFKKNLKKWDQIKGRFLSPYSIVEIRLGVKKKSSYPFLFIFLKKADIYI